MASNRTSPGKKSRGSVKTRESPGGSPKRNPQTPRAHRQDTPEARVQRQRIPKTHPTRATSAARKDKTQ